MIAAFLLQAAVGGLFTPLVYDLPDLGAHCFVVSIDRDNIADIVLLSAEGLAIRRSPTYDLSLIHI